MMVQYYADEEVWKHIENNEVKPNGCGSGWSALIIPDKWFGLDFTMSCHIHDAYYDLGKTNEDKIIADRIFYNNMLRVVETRPKCLRPFGRILARRYYNAVKDFGAVAFWSGKNKPEKMKEAIIDTTIEGIKVIKTIGAIT